MSTPATGAAATPVSDANGESPQPQVGQWADLPVAVKRNGPNSKFAAELNATAREQADHLDDSGKPQARIISMQKSPRSASGRASAIKRKLREDKKVNGLEFPAENFQIEARGTAVYAIYHAGGVGKPAPKATAKREARPVTKSETAGKAKTK